MDDYKSSITTTCWLACVCLLMSGCWNREPAPATTAQELSAVQIEAFRPQAVAMCGACHNTPDPAAFPKDAWAKEVQQGYDFYFQSDRRDIPPPPQEEMVAWFRTQAPAVLKIETPANTPSPVRFRVEKTSWPTPHPKERINVSHVLFRKTDSSSHALLCDMSTSEIRRMEFSNKSLTTSLIATSSHPAHIVPTDLNGDGQEDFLIADLGSFKPEDHDLGRVTWLRMDSSGQPQLVPLLTQVGRVADVRPADFDGDGDLDLVVAVFGWRKAGKLLLLRQTKVVDGLPQFETETLDKRHGAIHVPVKDLDGDGDLDFVVLFAQEHEEVDAFLNRGDGTFERQVIQLAGDPAYGSSGIELVDLDTDGDTDVLYSNGDSLDSLYVKPQHSIQWLENKGDFPFQRHHIGYVPGVTRAVAGDIDGDGDLDLAATAWLPNGVHADGTSQPSTFDALLWFEQTAPQQFTRHSLATMKELGFVALDLGDLDEDGDLDVIAGGYADDGLPFSQVSVFWNDGATGGAKRE